MEYLTLHIPARIEFGNDALERSGIVCSRFGVRALVVADQIGRDSGIVARLEATLEAGGTRAIVFDGIPPYATGAVVSEIVKLGRSGKVQFVVGIGDETVLSIAQLASAFIPRDVELESLFRSSNSGHSLPFVAVPTRAGHPYMLSDQALYIDSRDRSIAMMDSGNPADVVIMDPASASDASSAILTYVAVDLLLSCIEAFASKRATFLSNLYAREAVATLSPLLTAREPVNDESLQSIYQSGLLSAYAGIHTGIGVGGVLARCLAAKARVPAIAVSAILAPAIIRMQSDMMSDRMALLQAELPDNTGAEAIADAVGGILGQAGLPLQLRELQIKMADLLSAAYGAFETDMVQFSRLSLTVDELQGLLERSY